MTRDEYIVRLRFELLLSDHVFHSESKWVAKDSDGEIWEFYYKPKIPIKLSYWRNTKRQRELAANKFGSDENGQGRDGCYELKDISIDDYYWQESLISIKELLDD